MINTSHIVNETTVYQHDLPAAELSSLRAAEKRAREVARMIGSMPVEAQLRRGLQAELRQLADVTIPYQTAILGEAAQRQQAERAAREASDLARLQAMQG